MHHMNSWDRRADGVSGQLRNGRRVKEIDGRQTLQSEQQSVFFLNVSRCLSSCVKSPRMSAWRGHKQLYSCFLLRTEGRHTSVSSSVVLEQAAKATTGASTVKATRRLPSGPISGSLSSGGMPSTGPRKSSSFHFGISFFDT
jgi:hypothetical protein